MALILILSFPLIIPLSESIKVWRSKRRIKQPYKTVESNTSIAFEIANKILIDLCYHSYKQWLKTCAGFVIFDKKFYVDLWNV